jgi:hypothetical protein
MLTSRKDCDGELDRVSCCVTCMWGVAVSPSAHVVCATGVIAIDEISDESVCLRTKQQHIIEGDHFRFDAGVQ